MSVYIEARYAYIETMLIDIALRNASASRGTVPSDAELFPKAMYAYIVLRNASSRRGTVPRGNVCLH